jgi:hypothetical protein
MKSHYVHPDNKNQLGAFNLKSAGKGYLNVQKKGIEGAAAGTAVAPGIGTAVGAGVGMITGLVSTLFGKHSHKLNKQAYLNAPQDQVTLFWDAKFNGRSRSFPPGSYVWLGKGGRDKISSVKVPQGLKLEAWTGVPPDAPSPYSHPKAGKKVIWTSDQPYVGATWNDHIDTIRVSRLQPAGVTGSARQSMSKVKQSGMLWPLLIGLGVIGGGGLIIGHSKKS